jgi:hypothetical protein
MVLFHPTPCQCNYSQPPRDVPHPLHAHHRGSYKSRPTIRKFPMLVAKRNLDFKSLVAIQPRNLLQHPLWTCEYLVKSYQLCRPRKSMGPLVIGHGIVGSRQMGALSCPGPHFLQWLNGVAVGIKRSTYNTCQK